MKLNTVTTKLLLEKIYKKLLKKQYSRDIKMQNILDEQTAEQKTCFRELMSRMADNNFVHKRRKVDTWMLVEDEPKNYNQFIELDEKDVEHLEERYRQKNSEQLGYSSGDQT